jgi:hypothetical protein
MGAAFYCGMIYYVIARKIIEGRQEFLEQGQVKFEVSS